MSTLDEELIHLQREIVAEHIRAENAKDWEAVGRTFIQNQQAFYDVVPAHTRFPGIDGVRDFYAGVAGALPDLKVDVWHESDAPGCSLREVTVSGTHRGDWFGLAGTGRAVKFHLAAIFLFDADGRLLAERIYFDNQTVLSQMRGEQPVSAIRDFDQPAK